MSRSTAKRPSRSRTISSPTVVVLDLGLPGMDGYEVARRLRERPYGSRVTLVALTGWAGKEVRTKAAEAGFDYHLVKPVNWEELEARDRRRPPSD